MNQNAIVSRAALPLALVLLVWTGAGCKHTSRKTKPAVVETPTVSRPVVSSERRLQDQIDSMREQIGILSARAEAAARIHGSQMSPKWVDKVEAARTSGSNSSERMRFLDASKALLARKLQGLRDELKVYEEFLASENVAWLRAVPIAFTRSAFVGGHLLPWQRRTQ